MIVIQICPKCGHDLTDVVYTSFPPIQGVQCFHCGYQHFEPHKELIRVPYDPQFDDIHMDETKIQNGGYDVCSGEMHTMVNTAVVNLNE